MKLDAATLEVVRNRLDMIAEEMQATLVRSAHSTIVKEGLDASAALFDARGAIIAQANALPVHLGSLSPAVERICAVFPPARMHPGDVFVMNDPYEGAQHIPDLVVIVPVIVRGRTVGLCGSMAHQQDFGGKAPGSTPTDATEIFQEGLIVPPLRLYERGKVNETLVAILRKNVRLPDTLLGDIGAQVAAARTGRIRLLALFEEHGEAATLAYIEALQDRAEAMTRELIDRIPDGDYRFVDYLDNDGIELDKRIKIQATVSVRGSDFVVDFEGTDPQVRGPFNAVPSVAVSAVRYVVRAVTDPDIPNNAGCYRPISVKLPKGSVVNPTHPAPVNSRAVTLRRMIDVVMGALVQAIPDRVTAANNGHPLVCSIGGVDPESGRRYVSSMVATGGMGARPTKDGLEAIMTDASNAMNIPIEVVESYFPIRVRRWALRPDSGGAGRWRGGLGLDYSIEVLRGEVRVSHRGERHYTAPWGLFGGLPGATSRTEIVRRSGETTRVPSKLEFSLSEGDRVDFHTTGGGGYGDPLQREPERVLTDVLDGKVSPAIARETYGVVVEATAVDVRATTALRREFRQRRGPITWIYDRGELGREGRSNAAISRR